MVFVSFLFDLFYLASSFCFSFLLLFACSSFSYAGRGSGIAGFPRFPPPPKVCIKPCYYGAAPIPHPCIHVPSVCICTFLDCACPETETLQTYQVPRPRARARLNYLPIHPISAPYIPRHATPRPDADSLGAAPSPPTHLPRSIRRPDTTAVASPLTPLNGQPLSWPLDAEKLTPTRNL